MIAKIDLHVHPFWENYGLEIIVETMEQKDTNVLGLVGYNTDIYPRLQNLSKNLRKGFRAHSDDSVIRIRHNNSEKYLLSVLESETIEDFHILSIGRNGIKPRVSITEIIETSLEKGNLVLIDHPYADNKSLASHRDISKQKEEELVKICGGYSGKIALEWNSYCRPEFRILPGSGDVNQKVINLSEKLRKEDGHNVPVVADSDIHARNEVLLNDIGLTYIECDIATNSGDAIISSLKENIFANRHKNNFVYIPRKHLIFGYILPNLFKRTNSRG